MNTTTLSNRLPQAFWLLLAAVGVFLLSYVFFVQSSVYYMLAANESSTILRAEESKLSSLEGRYFALSRGLTSELALSRGLVTFQNPVYAGLDESVALGYLVHEDTSR